MDSGKKTKGVQDEIELLPLLIEKYDEEHNTFTDTDPVELIKALMKEHKMKAVDLSRLLGVSEGLVWDILHYKEVLSKEVIRKLAEYFRLSQEAFNRPYLLKTEAKTGNRKTRVRKTKRPMVS